MYPLVTHFIVECLCASLSVVIWLPWKLASSSTTDVVVTTPLSVCCTNVTGIKQAFVRNRATQLYVCGFELTTNVSVCVCVCVQVCVQVCHH